MQQEAQAETFDPVFRIRVSVDVYVKAANEKAARDEIEGMTLEQINYEADQGAYVAGRHEIVGVELIPDDRLDEEMAKVESDADFFRC